MGVVKEYRAMGRGAKKAEDGLQAWKNTRAVRMTAQMLGQYGVQMISTRQT
jgi:hypothetical protein